MRIIRLEAFKKRLPRLLCVACNQEPPVTKAYCEEDGCEVNMVLCEKCLGLARNGYITIYKHIGPPDAFHIGQVG